MKGMSNTMKGILGRVLSEEIAHQYNWQKDDIERFGDDRTGRDKIIEEIKQFMKDNDIEFREDFFFREVR